MGHFNQPNCVLSFEVYLRELLRKVQCLVTRLDFNLETMTPEMVDKAYSASSKGRSRS